MFTSDQVRDIIAKYHDFHEMVDFFKKYDQLFETDFKSSVSPFVRLPNKTGRRSTQ